VSAHLCQNDAASVEVPDNKHGMVCVTCVTWTRRSLQTLIGTNRYCTFTV